MALSTKATNDQDLDVVKLVLPGSWIPVRLEKPAIQCDLQPSSSINCGFGGDEALAF